MNILNVYQKLITNRLSIWVYHHPATSYSCWQGFSPLHLSWSDLMLIPDPPAEGVCWSVFLSCSPSMSSNSTDDNDCAADDNLCSKDTTHLPLLSSSSLPSVLPSSASRVSCTRYCSLFKLTVKRSVLLLPYRYSTFLWLTSHLSLHFVQSCLLHLLHNSPVLPSSGT